MKKRRMLALWILLSGISGWCSDEEGRLSLFVVGCFTPEFQEIFDGDLDGYLLIGNTGEVDGSYLPRNYFNDIPNQNCDLPLRRSKQTGPFNIMQGTFFEVQFEVDNTSTFGGGPFDAPNTTAVINYPEGLVPFMASNPCVVTNNKVTCNLGTVRAFNIKGVSIRFFAAKTGQYLLDGNVFSDLVDPNPANNLVRATVEVVAPQTRLIYPWISQNSQFSSIIVANNYGKTEALVWLSAVREEGDFHARPWVIPARGFLQDTTENLFPELGDGKGYAMRLISESPNIRGRWVSNNLAAASGSSPSQGVAIQVPDSQLSKNQRIGQDIMFGYLPISSTQVSAPVIVNMGDAPTDVTLKFYDEAGNLVLSNNQALAGMASYRPFATVANSLVGENSGDVYMIASSSSQMITGVGFVFNADLEPSIGNVSSIDRFEGDDDGTRLILPWISNNDQFESIVIVNNFGDAAATVSLTGRRNTGLAETVMRQIPANGFLNELASRLFPDLGDGSGYTVEVTSNASQLTGRWVSNNLTTPSQGSPSQGVGIRLDDKASPRFGTDILFGYLPLTEQFISAPVVVNIGTEATDVTMRFYNEMGQEIAVDTTTLTQLEPFRPFATVANNLVPNGSGDVYMVASSDGQPLTGVAFVFNSGAEPAIGNVSRIDFEP